MHFLDFTLPTLAENLALDEALLLRAEAGATGEVLRTWECPEPAVVLGAGCPLADDVDVAACCAAGVPILRRSSGGGTVLLNKGCLLYSLVLSYDRSPMLDAVRSSYEYILGRIRDSLGSVVHGVELAGTSDLAVSGTKFSGSSQQRKRCYLLHHGTILYAFDVEEVHRYLRKPARQPNYRRGRDHRDFLVNLSMSAEECKYLLRKDWCTETVSGAFTTAEKAPDTIAALVQQLVGDKYAQSGWVRRR